MNTALEVRLGPLHHTLESLWLVLDVILIFALDKNFLLVYFIANQDVLLWWAHYALPIKVFIKFLELLKAWLIRKRCVATKRHRSLNLRRAFNCLKRNNSSDPCIGDWANWISYVWTLFFSFIFLICDRVEWHKQLFLSCKRAVFVRVDPLQFNLRRFHQ